ncbi:hypothetical protein IAT38_005658 [Cryptococcus sp. DSM 104549]
MSLSTASTKSLRRMSSVNGNSASASVSNRGGGNRLSATPMKRGSVMFGTPGGMGGVGMGEFGGAAAGADEGEIVTGLKRIIEGHTKTAASLRNRIADLELHIAQNTSPQLDALSREVATLEDLLAETQRDNETKHAESERQKAYIKDLENLLNTCAGPNWRADHDLNAPLGPSNSFPASTPLPKPKPQQQHPLRHSVSFSAKRSTSKLHRRASSVMDMGGMGGGPLRAVEEAGEAVDTTSTGALKRLEGGMSGRVGMRLDSSMPREMGEMEVLQSPGRKVSKGFALSVSIGKPEQSQASSSLQLTPPIQSTQPARNPLEGIDTAQLHNVLQILSSLDPAAVSQMTKPSPAPLPSEEDRTRNSSAKAGRLAERAMLKRMFEEQEKRLMEREARVEMLVTSADEAWLGIIIRVRGTRRGEVTGSATDIRH